jgi:hypothetical protein
LLTPPASAKLLINNPFSGQVPDLGSPSSTNKSLFASFSEDKRRLLFFSEEKNQKTFTS